MNKGFIITEIKHIILVGKDEYKENKTVFGDDLPYNELILHLSGISEVKFNGKTFTCEKNTVRFLPKGKVDEYMVEREEVGECIDIFFETDTTLSSEAFTMKLNNNSNIETLFRKIFSVWVAKNDGFYFECMSLLYKIFAELQKDNYIPKKQYDVIKPAIEYIEENFLDGKISMELLAEKCGISGSYLKKLFIKKFSVPPVKYMIQLRINHACDLLRSGRYSVGQTAEICGYSNTYFFSRQFKSYTGITPVDFKNKYKSSK